MLYTRSTRGNSSWIERAAARAAKSTVPGKARRLVLCPIVPKRMFQATKSNGAVARSVETNAFSHWEQGSASAQALRKSDRCLASVVRPRSGWQEKSPRIARSASSWDRLIFILQKDVLRFDSRTKNASCQDALCWMIFWKRSGWSMAIWERIFRSRMICRFFKSLINRLYVV